MWGQCGGTRTGWMVGRRFLRFVFCFICFRLFHLECGVTPRLELSRARSLFPSRQFNPRLLRPEVRRVIEMLLDNDWPGPCVSHRSKVPFLRSIGGPLDPNKNSNLRQVRAMAGRTLPRLVERGRLFNPGRCRLL